MEWETISMIAQMLIIILFFIFAAIKLSPVIKKVVKSFKKMRRMIP